MDNYLQQIAAFQKALSDPEQHQTEEAANRTTLAQMGHALFEQCFPSDLKLSDYK